jgi:predicted lipoprotein
MLSSTKHTWRIGATNYEGWLRSRREQLCALIYFAVLALAAGAGLLCGHAQSPQAQTPERSASTQTPAQVQQDKQQSVSAPVEQHKEGGKQEVASECADLLKMATDLKTEVDKTTKDTLSLTVVRKAGEIEQLAHKVRTGTGKS